MKLLSHKRYRQLTLIILFPLLATGLTGIIYGFSDRFWQLPDIIAKGLMAIHQGLFLGEKIAPIYALLMGLGVFALGLKALIESKEFLLSWNNTQSDNENIYYLLILIIAIPLAFCVETGVAYQIGRDWFGISSQQAEIFLNIHGGASLGHFWGILYLLTAGLGLIGLSIISYKATKISVVQRQKNQQVSALENETSAYGIDNFALEEVKILTKNVRVGISILALVFIAIFYATTQKLLISIVIIGIIFVAPALIIAEKLISIWQTQRQIQAKLYEREAESLTMLKAVPDSMLRISQEGICLSYMPAKEGKCFILDGDIVNKHVREFLAPEIAQQFITFTQLTLHTGSTHFHRFPVSLDEKEQYYEARITPIGQTEVLIMVREIGNFDDTAIEPIQIARDHVDNKPIQLLNELELTQILDNVLREIQQNPQNHILFCLAIEQTEINNNSTFYIDDNLRYQIVNKINIYLKSNVIARLDNNGLVILVKDCSLKQASVLVEDLYKSLREFSDQWQNGTSAIKVNLGLLEINIHSLDVNSLMNAARTTCEMAKQKVNVKTFW